MNRRDLLQTALATSASLLSPWALAADEAPDALIERLTREALDVIDHDPAVHAGDVPGIIRIVDAKVMPHLNFARMTAMAVGPGWRNASATQREHLQAEFKTLLVRTYAGALSQAKNLKFKVKPARFAPEDQDVIVRTQVLGRGDPIQLDYRLEKTPGQGAGWKIYNFNAMGIWMVDTYRTQFASVINAKGVDGLIADLAERNKANSAADKPAKG